MAAILRGFELRDWPSQVGTSVEEELRNTDCNSSNLKISGLQPKADQNAQYQQVPDRVAFIHKVSRYIDVSKPSHHSTQNLRPQKPNERPETPLRNITLSPFGSKKSHTAKSPSSRVTRGRMTKEASLSLGGRDTQQSLVNNMNDDLHGMMQPEQITQGDTQTQGVFNSTDTFPDASTATPTTIRALVLGPDEIETPFKIAAYSLRSAIRKRVQSKKLELQSEVVALAQKAGGTTASGEIIVCQCGLRKEEGDMVSVYIFGHHEHFLTPSLGPMLQLHVVAASSLLRICRKRRPPPPRRASAHLLRLHPSRKRRGCFCSAAATHY